MISSFYYFTEEIVLQNGIIKNVLNDDQAAPDMWEIESNADLLLINSYEVLNNIRPSVPTTVYLGGIHRKTETPHLSSSLAQFLDDSEQVVYVNLYNVMQNPLRLMKLLNALEAANVDVIWRTNDDFVNISGRNFQGSNFEQESILGEFTHFIFRRKSKRLLV